MPQLSDVDQNQPPASVSASAATTRTVSLCQLQVGDCGVIVEKKLDDADRAMLRAMGLEASATIRVCRAGEPCIVAVLSGGAAGGRLSESCCRIGLARPLAERIMVSPQK